jgi:hypothetical protein
MPVFRPVAPVFPPVALILPAVHPIFLPVSPYIFFQLAYLSSELGLLLRVFRFGQLSLKLAQFLRLYPVILVVLYILPPIPAVLTAVSVVLASVAIILSPIRPRARAEPRPGVFRPFLVGINHAARQQYNAYYYNYPQLHPRTSFNETMI